jgi:trehalose/maltose hydrolase-like predicted phosphorylase
MGKPISPPPVAGGLRGELPAYLSNGVIGLRVRPNPLSAGMTLVSGLAGRHPSRHIEAAALAPYPLAVDISLDGVWTSDASDALTIVDQAYAFETAELTTRLVYQPGEVRAEITVVTFCSRDDPTIVCQELRLRLDGLAKVVLRPMIDARGIEGRALAHERQTPEEAEPACDGSLLWETEGALSTCGLAMATHVDAPVETRRPAFQRGRLYTEHGFEGDQRREYRLHQIVSVTPNAIHDQADQHAVRMVALARRQGFEAIREANRKQWRDLWRGRIELVGAPPRWQALADASFYYLMASAHPSSPSSTSIFGLATWGDYHYYYGHVMWDLETFAVPPLVFLQPGAAEALLDYRSRTLEAARKNALARGHRGLQFPWESGPATGQEAAPLPGTASWHEDHVTPDVARAFALYAAAGGDEAFMRERAWPVLSGVAEWIASRVTPTERGHELKGSMGIAERQQESDNPAFAVLACQAALDDALDMAERLGKPAPSHWRTIRDTLVLPMQGDLLASHDDYRPDEEKGETPDPLMAFFPLWRDLGADVERATLAHYLSLADAYAGAPMLSGLLGVWAAWSGDRALSARLLEEGYGKFVSDRFNQILEYRPDRFPEQPTAGPFVANMGAFLLSLIQGFPALRPTLDAPGTWPARTVVLPEGWEAIRIGHLWVRGQAYRLDARQGQQTTLEPVETE